MFEFVRTHTRLMLGLLVLLIIPSFVFFGVEGYSQFNDKANVVVAEVAGQKVRRSELDAAHQRQLERIRAQMPTIDPKLLDDPELLKETLEQIVRERVLLAAAADMHIAISDDRLQRSFQSDPQLAFLRNPDGTVNRDVLAAQGMSSEQFAARYRQDLALQQVLNGVAATTLVTSAPRRLAFNALLEQRAVQFQVFDANDYLSKVQPTDADLTAYYDNPANQEAYKTPETAAIEYVVLDLDTLKKDVVVPDEELTKFYNENAARYSAPEERRASHILVKADKDTSAADRAKAKAKAEGLLAELRKNPAAFADLARKNSDDPGSAAQGGDLDFFGRGAMVKPFEDAAYGLKVGEISGLVETDFGYHIIRVDAVRGGDRKPFEAVKAEIADEFRKQAAQKKYVEAAEQFSNTVYEQSDSLQPVIDKLKLTRQTATVQRTPAAGATGPLASPKLLDAVFGNEALRNKRNTDAIETGPNQLVAARVTQHNPQRLLPLEAVKDRVMKSVALKQAGELARKDSQARLEQLKKTIDDTAGMDAEIEVSRAQPKGLPPPVLDAVLRADATKLPAALSAEVGSTTFAVIRLNAVKTPDLASADVKALEPRYAQAWGAAEADAYYHALKTRYKVETKPLPAAAASAPGN